jgi:hypothetical protein
MKRHIIAAALVSIGFAAAPQAQASEWGCKVLLCASSPNWRAVPECHPPMYKLMACLSAWKPCSFPTCPEGGSGAPGYVPFENCPSGSQPAYADNDNQSGEMDMCMWPPPDRYSLGGKNDQPPAPTYTPRPRRVKPYYFDIKDDSLGQTTRHWFELNG